MDRGTAADVPRDSNQPLPEAHLPIVLTSFSAFFGCAFGSVVPLVNTELLILGIAAVTPRYAIWPIVLLATIGTMLGKAVLYYAGRGLVRLRIRGREKIDAFLADIEKRQGLTGSLLFVSAASGFPPFYVVTMASGAAGMALSRFLVVGFVGRFLRYAAIVIAPHLIREILP